MRFIQLFRRQKQTWPNSDPFSWSNEAWLEALGGPNASAALEALRTHLIQSLGIGLRRHETRIATDDIEDFVQEALIRITANLSTFRGESRFLTWSNKIALRVAFSQLRRRRWQDVSIEAMGGDGAILEQLMELHADSTPSSDELTNRSMILDMIQRVMQEELTPRQRTALVATVMHGMPLEEVARQMGTNRNALYKLMHDARKRLKTAIEARGFSMEDLVGAED